MKTDTETAQLLNFLHRGGSAAYWWVAPGKLSTWWLVGKPAPLPSGSVNIYFGVHPTAEIPERWEDGRRVPSEKTRSRLVDIAAISCLFAEFDAKDFVRPEELDPEEVNALAAQLLRASDAKLSAAKAHEAADKLARENLIARDPSPYKARALAHVDRLTAAPASAVIDSGGGYHGYWLLRECFPLTTPAERERARVAQAAWVAYAGGDDGAKDLARVLRLPGTVNRKYAPPRPVTILRADFARCYTLGDLETVSRPAERPATERRNGQAYAGGESDARFWYGQAVDKATIGNRNATGFWLACQLRDSAKLSEEETKAWLRDFAGAVPQAAGNPYTEAAALASVRSAYGRDPRDPAQSTTGRTNGRGHAGGGLRSSSASGSARTRGPDDPRDEDPAGDDLPDDPTAGQLLRLQFEGFLKGGKLKLRRNGYRYVVTVDGSSWRVNATAGSARKGCEVIIDPETPATFAEAAAAIGQALGIDTEEVRQDLAELPAHLRTHPAPEAAPAPTDPASLADFAPWVTQRLGDRSGRAVKVTVTGAICAWLAEKGRLLRDEETNRPYMLADDRRALPLDDEGLTLKATLATAGLNPTEPTFAWLLAELQVKAFIAGQVTALARWGKVTDKGALCVSCGPVGYVKALPGQPLTYHANGDEGLVFAADACLPAWDWTAAPVDPLSLAVFQPAMTTPAEAPAYTAEVQRRLLATWLCALVAQVKPLPILAALGDKGGGKSTLGRAVLRVLLGSNADLTGVSTDRRDFVTLAARLPVLGLDNVDGEPPEWLADDLARAATGGRSQTRELYTNNDVSDVALQAAIVITSRTAGFARADVAERLLPILTGELTDAARLADSALEETVNAQRDGLLVYLVTTAANVLAWRPHAPAGLPARFLDFAQVVWSWHKATGQEALARPTLEAWRAAQALSVRDADPLLMAILEYCPKEGINATAVQVVKTLTNAGAELPNLGGGKKIAGKLRELRASLSLFGWVLKEDPQGEHVFFDLRKRA